MANSTDEVTESPSYVVKRVLGHSGFQDVDNTIYETKFLVEWDGEDADGNPHQPTWENFVDVGIPVISTYMHRIGMGYPRLSMHKPDGFVYQYADNEDQKHIPRGAAPVLPAKASAAPAKDKTSTSPAKKVSHRPPATVTKSAAADEDYDPKRGWDSRKPTGVRKTRSTPKKKGPSS